MQESATNYQGIMERALFYSCAQPELEPERNVLDPNNYQDGVTTEAVMCF